MSAFPLLLVFAAGQVPTREPVHTAVQRFHTLLHESQQRWTPAELDLVRADLVADTRGTLIYLVDQLDDGSAVGGLMDESTSYTVCGNALTLLEDLTSVRIDGRGGEWIGFRTHDHRSCLPSSEELEAPWQAWLAVRAELPTAQWFSGLSAAEIQPLLALLTAAPATWKNETVDRVRALGSRAYPFLIEKILDDEYSAGERVTDRADALLRLLTKKEAGTLTRHELLTYDPSDPMRALSTHLNRASMHLVHQRWIEVLAR